MQSRFARLLLILTALWLPLQAVAGLTMKIVTPTAAASAGQTPVVEETCPYHRPDADTPATPQPTQQKACDDCGVCHFAATGYMPVAQIVAGVIPTARSFQPSPAAERPSHIPEPPQYPPRRA